MDTAPDLVLLPPFEASSNSVQVNVLWFASLVLSLSAAFLAVLAKQWIHNLTFGIPSSPSSASYIRQYRLDGLQKWRLPAVIGFLPIFLHLSLILFFAGLILFLIPINTTVMAVISIFSGATVLFYAVTNILSGFIPAFPYQTSLTLMTRGIGSAISMVYLWSRIITAEIVMTLCVNCQNIYNHLKYDDRGENIAAALVWLFSPFKKIYIKTSSYMLQLFQSGSQLCTRFYQKLETGIFIRTFVAYFSMERWIFELNNFVTSRTWSNRVLPTVLQSFESNLTLHKQGQLNRHILASLTQYASLLEPQDIMILAKSLYNWNDLLCCR